MKKLLLFFALSTLLFSCAGSDSDNATGGKISFKVNGVQKTFDDVTVSQNIFFEGTPDEYTELNVYGTSEEFPDESIFLEFYKGNTEFILGFAYNNNGEQFYRAENGFTTNTTANGNNKKLKGTFSGQLHSFESSTIYTLTDGIFDVKY